MTLTPSVNSISAMSRPTSSQWRLSTSTLWAIMSSGPIAFHMSAYLATVRERLLLAAAADHDRHARLDRPRLVAQVVERVATAGR